MGKPNYNAIILEGPDGCGKSTFGKLITERTGLSPHHAGGVPKTLKGIIKRTDDIYDMAQGIPTHFFDRHTAISELIYGQVLRNDPKISISTSMQMLKALNPLIFYLRPSDHTLMGRKKFITNDESKPDHKPKAHREELKVAYWSIVTEYDHLMARLSMDFMVIQFDPTLEPVSDSILDNIARNI